MIRHLKKFIKSIYNKLFFHRKENEYYTDFFTKNTDWNTPEPNQEEILRWQIIESYILYIQEQFPVRNDSNCKILDLGCGRGWLSNLLSKYGDVIGIEPIKAVVEYGKQLFPHLNLKGGTAQNLINEGKTNFFDIVVCSEVIEHVPDKKKVDFLDHIKTLLKPHGFLILTTPRKDAQVEWNKYVDPDQPIED